MRIWLRIKFYIRRKPAGRFAAIRVQGYVNEEEVIGR
jgi:hypothetical protein